MADILHDFIVHGTLHQVFHAISTPSGLDSWWSKTTAGHPEIGAHYHFHFGSHYNWRATVARYIPNEEFELEMTGADPDWLGTRIGFTLAQLPGDAVKVRFQHTGWAEHTDHFRTSSYCWAMYLRLMKRYVETGEVVPYEDRLNV